MGRTKKEWWAASFMALIQVFTTGQMLLTKVVVDDGLSVCTLLTYRFFMGAILVIPLAVIFEKLALQSPRILSCVLLLSCCVNCQPPYTLDRSKKQIALNCIFFSYENCKSWSLLPNITNRYSLYSYYQQKKICSCSYLHYFDLNMLCWTRSFSVRLW